MTVGVLKHIQRLNKSGECFDLQAYKGATFRDIVGVAEGYLPKHDFDVIYIAGGANDITFKDRRTNMIHYRWGPGEDLKVHLVNILQEADSKLSKNFLASRIVFCPLIGSELTRVVNAHRVRFWDLHSFLVYVNDMESVLPICKVKLYADDMVLYQSGENSKIGERKLQESMNNFANWCSSNALTINTKKTKIMASGSHSKVKKCKNASVTLHGVKIKSVPSYKYLGVSLDQTLDYNNHISTSARVIQHKLSLLGKVRNYLNRDIALQVYNQ